MALATMGSRSISTPAASEAAPRAGAGARRRTRTRSETAAPRPARRGPSLARTRSPTPLLVRSDGVLQVEEHPLAAEGLPEWRALDDGARRGVQGAEPELG